MTFILNVEAILVCAIMIRAMEIAMFMKLEVEEWKELIFSCNYKGEHHNNKELLFI